MAKDSPTMSDTGRRGKFSILLWPSLYSVRTIFAVQCIFVLAASFIALGLHISRIDERQLLSRAAERIRAAQALKLSGVETWQWKRELGCTGFAAADCLKLTLSFTQPRASDRLTEKIHLQEPCKICHAGQRATGSYYASFESIPAGFGKHSLDWFIFSAVALLGLALLFYMLRLRRRRIASGICIAAFEHDPATEKDVKQFLKDVFSSRRFSYYAESAPRRLRLATTPERFRKLLETYRDLLEKNRGSLRCVALRADLKAGSIIPVDMLRMVYNFLAHIPQRTYLIEERLAAEFEPPYENERRLVFKNKSGASLKFIPWTGP